MNAQLVHPMLTMPAPHNRITHQFPLPSRPTHSSSDYINNPPGTDKDAAMGAGNLLAKHGSELCQPTVALKVFSHPLVTFVLLHK